MGIALTPIPRILCDDDKGENGGTHGTDSSKRAGPRPVKLYKIDCGGGISHSPGRQPSDSQSQKKAKVLYVGNKNPDYQEVLEESDNSPNPSPLRHQ